MEKLSMEKVSGLAKEAATQLRLVTAERDDLREKLARLERRQECEKIASIMHAKGVSSESMESLVETLEKKAEAGQLESVKTALDMVGPDMWSKLASQSSDEDKNHSGDKSGFESVIMSLGQRHR